MAKKVESIAKLQIPAGKATPAPPVGSILGAKGVNIQQFVQQFNAQTADMGNDIVPVVISIYEDKTFSFVLKTPPAAYLIKQALGLEHGSGQPHIDKVGQLSKDQLREIAEKKMPDLNANDVEAAMKVVQGTARSMGVRIEGVADTGTYVQKRKNVVEEPVAEAVAGEADEAEAEAAAA